MNKKNTSVSIINYKHN